MYYIVDKIRRSGDPIKSRANSLSRTKAGAKIPQSSEGTTRPEKLCVALLRGVSTSRLSAQSILLPNPLRLSARPPRPLFFLLTTTAQILAVTKQQSSRCKSMSCRSFPFEQPAARFTFNDHFTLCIWRQRRRKRERERERVGDRETRTTICTTPLRR